MALIRRGNTSPNIETRIKNDPTSQITRIKTEARIERRIIRANTGIKTETGTNIALVPSRTRRSMTVARTRRRKAPRPAKIRSTKAAVPPVRIRARTRNIITSRVQAPKTRTGEKEQKHFRKTDVYLISLCLLNIL